MSAAQYHLSLIGVMDDIDENENLVLGKLPQTVFLSRCSVVIG